MCVTCGNYRPGLEWFTKVKNRRYVLFETQYLSFSQLQCEDIVSVDMRDVRNQYVESTYSPNVFFANIATCLEPPAQFNRNRYKKFA
jgi:hypothetical protein